MQKRRGAELVVVLGLTALALAIRLYRLPDIPPGLFNDEAANGFDILNILRGQHPIFFAANTGREPLFIYLQAMVVALLGATPWALRLTSAIIGSVTVPALYWLARETFARSAVNARSLAFWAALFLALSYWHINFSRIGLRVIMLPLLACLTFAWFWRAWHRLNGREPWPWADLILCGICLGASLYTYVAARLLPVLLVFVAGAGLLLRQGCSATWRRKIAASVALILVVALLVFAPLGLYYVSHPDIFWQHSSNVSVLSASVNAGRPLAALGQSVARTAGMFGFTADAQWRHNPAQRPAFDPLLALWLAAGTVLAAVRSRQLPYLFLLAWLFLLAVPAMLTEEAPHFLRTLGLAPAAYMLAVLPILAVGEWLAERGPVFVRDRPWLAYAVPLPFLLLSGAYDLRSYFTASWSGDHLAFDFDVPFGQPVTGMVAVSGPQDLWLQPVWPVYAIPDQHFVADFLSRGQIKAVTVRSDEEHAPGQLQAATQGYERAYLLDAGVQLEPEGGYVLADWKDLFKFLLSKYARPLPGPANGREGMPGLTPATGFVGYTAYSLPVSSTYQIATAIIPLDLSFAGQVRLAGAAYGHTAGGQQVTAASLEEPWVPAGGVVWAVLRWQAQAPLSNDLRAILLLLDTGGREVARSESPLTGDEYLYTQDWPAGRGSSTYHIMPIPPNMQPGSYHLYVAVAKGDGTHLYTVTGGAAGSGPGRAALLGDQEVTAPAKPAPQYPANVSFGTNIRFLGHDLATPAVRAGAVLPVTLYWQVQAAVTNSYTVFAHLLGPDGRIWAQNDGIPALGQAPTNSLAAGTYVADSHGLAISVDAPPGTYTLEIGMYQADSGQRLPVSDRAGQPHGDHILLDSPVQVVPRTIQ